MPLPLHGGQLQQIALEFGIDVSKLLDFSANINPDGPPASVVATLRANLDDLSILTEYPDLQQIELKSVIASSIGVARQNIVVANGFVPLLETTLQTLRVQSCCLPVPAFVEYRKTLERVRVEIVPYTISTDSGFRYDIAKMASGQHDAILLANPQNPSGACHNSTWMRDLVTRAAEKNIYVFLDEAFIDYASQNSLASATDEFANLIVFRSVTKFHAIPGLRVAYAVASPELSSSINEDLPPWPITTLASQAVIAALADQPYADRTIDINIHRRTNLQRDLNLLGLVVYPSEANFLLFRLKENFDPNDFWRRMILDHHIVLRHCANYEGLGPGHFRVAVRTEEENAKLQQALKSALSYPSEPPTSGGFSWSEVR